MRKLIFLAMILVFAGAFGASQASAQAGQGFGYSFLRMFDDDGDGIPNGQDEDWEPPIDGSGYQIKNGIGRILDGMVSARNGETFKYQYRYQQREKRYEPAGDTLRTRLRLWTRDCK